MSAQVKVSDHVIWLTRIQGGSALRDRLTALEPQARVLLRVDGARMAFRRMQDGRDGRPTLGLRPDADFVQQWNALYETKRGEMVSLELESVQGVDPYLAGLEPVLAEWLSPEDEEAFGDL